MLNERGWDRAVAAGCDEANIVVCASDGFGIRNQGAPVAEQVRDPGRDRRAPRRRGRAAAQSLTISVAFG